MRNLLLAIPVLLAVTTKVEANGWYHSHLRSEQGAEIRIDFQKSQSRGILADYLDRKPVGRGEAKSIQDRFFTSFGTERQIGRSGFLSLGAVQRSIGSIRERRKKRQDFIGFMT